MRRWILPAALTMIVALATPVVAQDALATAVTTQQEMVVTTNPLATEAGEQILRNGGSAADALVTVQTVLGLVEPQSTGIGGGSFVVWYDAATGETTTYDARETT
ncbi:MAG TPA: gamma-glutamyltransferase, partial [Nitriliruptoraceae bacterium]|nr:gamma-glutamyltransferase [Nitriliruptoraceae bacterium]